MTLQDIYDSIARNVEGGKTGQGSILDPQYVKKMIHAFRAMLIERDFKQTGIVQPSCYQRCYLSFSQNLQASAPCGAVLFNFPQTIALGKEDGIRYVGSLNSKTWRRIFTRGELNTLNQHPYTRLSNNPNTVYVLFDNTNGRLEVYNDPLVTEGMVDGVFSDPTQVTNGNGGVYNESTDPYPIEENALAELKSLIYGERTSITKATPPELNPDVPQENVVRPFKPQQIQQQ